MKGLVSHHRRKGERPKWIRETLWAEMEASWATEDAQEKSANASQNRNSDREGLGPHKHVGGPRSYAQIKRDKEASLGRPVGIGEVFIDTHTRKDGTFVDEKAKRIADAYNEKVQAKENEIANDPSVVSDGTSKLSTTELDKLFLEATIPDDRGNRYGLGRLAQSIGSGTDSWSSSSTIVASLQEQLQAAQKKIEEQEHENRRRDAELARRDGELQRTKDDMDIMFQYLKNKDPEFATFMQSRTTTNSDDVNGSNDPEPSS